MKNFIQNLFSLKNMKDNCYKELIILGIKIKFKRKKYRSELSDINWKFEYLSNKIKELENLSLMTLYNLNNNIPKEKRILFVTHEFSISGAPLILVPVVDFFKRKGFYVSVLSYADGPLRNFYEKNGINTFVLNDICNNQVQFIRIASNYGLLFANTVAAYAAIYLAKGMCKTIWWIHESQEAEQWYTKVRSNNGIPAILDVMKEAETIYTVSDYSKSVVSKYNDNVKILKYGIEDLYNRVKIPISDKKRTVFSMIGIVQPRKAHDVFIKAVSELPKEYQDKILVNLVGSYDSDWAMDLKEKSKKLSNVIWHGLLLYEDKYKIYRETDVVVCVSQDDPEPIVVTEGMMWAKPCLISNNVGQKNVISDGYNGFIVETNNVESLKNKVMDIIDNREKLQEIGARSREIYQNIYTFNAFEDRLENLINQENLYDLSSNNTMKEML